MNGDSRNPVRQLGLALRALAVHTWGLVRMCAPFFFFFVIGFLSAAGGRQIAEVYFGLEPSWLWPTCGGMVAIGGIYAIAVCLVQDALELVKDADVLELQRDPNVGRG